MRPRTWPFYKNDAVRMQKQMSKDCAIQRHKGSNSAENALICLAAESRGNGWIECKHCLQKFVFFMFRGEIPA